MKHEADVSFLCFAILYILFVTLLIEFPANFRFRQTIKVVICCGLIYCAQSKSFFLCNFYIFSTLSLGRMFFSRRKINFHPFEKKMRETPHQPFRKNSKVYGPLCELQWSSLQNKISKNSLLRQHITFNSFENIIFHTSCGTELTFEIQCTDGWGASLFRSR